MIQYVVNLKGAYNITNEEAILKSIDSKLDQLIKWTKFQGMQQVKQILETTLDNDDKKLVYELSDGRPSTSIATVTCVSDQTVRNYWKVWASMGILEIHPEYKKRYRKIFSLEEGSIAIPLHEDILIELENKSEEDNES